MDLQTFCVETATKYGVHEAVFVARVKELIRSKLEECVYDDGLWWYPCAIYEWDGEFPFWSARQVDRVVKSCLSQGLLYRRQYETDERRRRGWYAIRNNGVGQ